MPQGKMRKMRRAAMTRNAIFECQIPEHLNENFDGAPRTKFPCVANAIFGECFWSLAFGGRSFYWIAQCTGYPLKRQFIWWATYGLYINPSWAVAVSANTLRKWTQETDGARGNQNKCTHLNIEQKHQIDSEGRFFFIPRFTSIRFNCRYIH